MKSIIAEITIQVLSGEINRKELVKLYGAKLASEVKKVLNEKTIIIKN